MSDIPVLATCARCGRGFLTLPKSWPATDPYGPANQHYRAGDQIPTCGGDLELTDAGRAALEQSKEK